MKGSHSGGSFRTASTTLIFLISAFVIIGSSLVSSRSVENLRHHQRQHHAIRESNDDTRSEELHYESQRGSSLTNLPDNGSSDEAGISSSGYDTSVQIDAGKSEFAHEEELSLGKIGNERVKLEDGGEDSGKSSVNSASASSENSGPGLIVDQEGIRRFDAVVSNEGTIPNLPDDREKEKLGDRITGNPQIDKTITKGITVRDEAVNTDGIQTGQFHNIDESSGKLKTHDKRSSENPEFDSAGSMTLKNDESSEERFQTSSKPAQEQSLDAAKSGKVLALVPAGVSSSLSFQQTSSEYDDGLSIQSEKTTQEKILQDVDGQDGRADESFGTGSAIPEPAVLSGTVSQSARTDGGSIEIPLESNEERSLGDKFISGMKTTEILEENSSEVVQKPRVETSDPETIHPIGEDDSHPRDYVKPESNEHVSKLHRDSLVSPFLTSLLRTDVSLDELKGQAFAFQGLIKNKTFLERLQNEKFEILPEIPKFTEAQLGSALNTIASLKKIDDNPEYSYISKIDTSSLSESQLNIVRCTEGLVLREQRQTFVENLSECIRGLSFFNCMRIFVWPVIVDNIPESYAQNLPSLPIQVNVADWLPGSQKGKQKSSRSSSATNSHERKLVTPEVIVSNILKDALSENSSGGDDLPTFIDMKNETLSKLLTPGQIDILRMAEKFLPLSSRQEYSEKMYSCVCRFEYFSCVKFFTWPMVKQYFPGLPDFPDYQSWYPNISSYPGYPILPYPNVEGVGELPEVVEADATRTASPTPESVIVQILENVMRRTPKIPQLSPSSYAPRPLGVLSVPISVDQMAIFYTAEQMIPVSKRYEFMSRTIKCIQDYDFLSCTKYSTWPTIRQLYPALPQFPDFSSWIPTFAVPEIPDFSEYITNLGGYFPIFPGVPGSSAQQPQPSAPQEPELQSQTQSQPSPSQQPQPQAPPQPYPPEQSQQPPEPYPPQQPGTQPPQQPQQQPEPYPPTQPQPYPPQQPQLQPQPYPPKPQPGQSQTQQHRPDTVQPPYHQHPYPRPQPEVQTQPQSQPQPELNPQPPSQLPPEMHGQPQPGVQPQPQLQPAQRPQQQTQPQPHPEIHPVPNTDRPPYFPQPIAIKPPSTLSDEKYVDSLHLSDKHPSKPGSMESMDLMENRIIQILSNIRTTGLIRDYPQSSAVTQERLALLRSLTYNQLRIVALSKSVVPDQVRVDLDARFTGCLQGRSDFLSCTKNVIWPTLQLYVKDLPVFPQDRETETSAPVDRGIRLHPADSKATGLPESYVITPAIYQPLIQPAVDIAGRSPVNSHIVAESEEESPSLNSQAQSELTRPSNIPSGDASGSQLRQEATAKSGDTLTPVISITDTRFTPISDHPETVLLKILTTVQSSIKLSDNSQTLGPSDYLESLNEHLNSNQKSVIRIAENLLPASAKQNFMEGISGCIKNSNFVLCTRDLVWPAVSQYYPSLPGFPNFNIGDEPGEKIEPVTSGPKKPIVPGARVGPLPISETDVKTGQHGNAMVTITDTRFVPIFSDHPEELILGILKNLQTSLPNSSGQQGTTGKTTRQSLQFAAAFTEQQANIITVAENLLPESLRQVFNNRMIECVKDDEFLDCTRDIAWPTIAQFFPRLSNFPNIGALPGPTIENKPEQQQALLPPHFEPTEPVTLTIPVKPTLALPTENFTPVTPEDAIESRIESTLKHLLSTTYAPLQRQHTYLGTKDPLMNSLLTERQLNILGMSSDLVPDSIEPIFVAKMTECTRADVFLSCIRNVGWPILRQYLPNIPEFPEFGYLGTYFPQVPQELPQAPQFPEYQLPTQLPNLPEFSLIGPGYVQPFKSTPDIASQQGPTYVPQVSKISSGQHTGFYITGIQGLTPSVDSAASISSGIRTGSSGYSLVVPPGYPSSQPSHLLSSDNSMGIAFKLPESPKRRRKRRSLDTPDPRNQPDFLSNDVDPVSLNLTESDFVEILVDITERQSNGSSSNPDDYFVERLNSTMKKILTEEQSRVLAIVERINSRTAKAGFISKVMQCVTSLSVIRCMGIFVWPVIAQNLPSLPSLPIFGLRRPLAGSREIDHFQDIFGMTGDEFEREVIARKKNVEEMLVEWYRQLEKAKFDKYYGFIRVQGYGNGEIGITFNGLERTSRGAKIKDNKNLPSILTILSDIMEDMLDQSYSRSVHDKKNENGKRNNLRRDKSIRERVDIGNYNEDLPGDSSHDSGNDDKIIAMFLDRIKSNATGTSEDASGSNDYPSIEKAYEAFELLFGTRLRERMAETLNIFSKKDSRSSVQEEAPRKFFRETFDNDKRNRMDKKKRNNLHSGLVLKLPQIDEKLVSRKITSGLIDFGRKMKMQMSQIIPGITFVVSFFIQIALAHARAAASIAGMMSNMALGSAMLSMLRQSLFGSMSQPKIKYVYDNAPMGPGITWPQSYHH